MLFIDVTVQVMSPYAPDFDNADAALLPKGELPSMGGGWWVQSMYVVCVKAEQMV